MLGLVVSVNECSSLCTKALYNNIPRRLALGCLCNEVPPSTTRGCKTTSSARLIESWQGEITVHYTF